MTDELAKAVPKVMIEIAAQGLPHNMLLEVKVAEALFHALNEALESLNPPIADLTVVDPPVELNSSDEYGTNPNHH